MKELARRVRAMKKHDIHFQETPNVHKFHLK